MMSRRVEKRMAVLDIETTQFKAGRVVIPLAAALYDGVNYIQHFGIGCIDALANDIKDMPPMIIYAHNGGRFDFHFFVDYLYNPIKVISDRIVECGFCEKHLFRDSYAAIPIPLSAFNKSDFDYSVLELDKFQYHRGKILKYLKSDCINLFDMLTQFHSEHGKFLTIGAAAFSKLRDMHDTETTHERHDSIFRPFYHGGRVQVFQDRGVHKNAFTLYDVNSMYPFVMKKHKHPIGMKYYICGREILDKHHRINKNIGGHNGANTYFFSGRVRDKSKHGVLPHVVMGKTHSQIIYKNGEYDTMATSHELQAAKGYFDIISVDKIYVCSEQQDYSAYVNHFHKQKNDAEKSGNKAMRTFAKLFLNSAYGKFGQNPLNFHEFYIVRHDDVDIPDMSGWELWQAVSKIKIYRKGIEYHRYNDVATAASITGAARAVLLKGILKTPNIFYCDTDSIICHGKFGGNQGNRLGAWQVECAGDEFAIAAKKLYALFDKGECVRCAHKGVRITPQQIKEISLGNKVEYVADAPIIKFGNMKVLKRTIKRDELPPLFPVK